MLTGSSPWQGVTREVLFMVGTILSLLNVPWFDQPLWLELTGAIMAIWAAVSGGIAAIKSGGPKGTVVTGLIDTIGRKILAIGSVVLVSFSGVITPDDWAQGSSVVLSILGIIGMILPALISKVRKEEAELAGMMERQLIGEEA